MTLGTVNRMHSIRSFQNLQEVLAPKRAQVVDHPLHGRLATLDDVHLFMEHHVFAVWDFMSLLKSLQRELTCVEVPWIPRGDAASRRMVNEIVLGEESDEDVNGGYLSHFELYRAAMQQCGADSSRIDAFLRHVTGGISVQVALTRASAPAAAQRFVLSTFQTIESGSVPRIAAAFTLGREDIIPDMFRRLVADLSRQSRDRLSRFLDYIDRHIRLDGERHGPMAARLLDSICGTSSERWEEAFVGARDALEARRVFWDDIATVVGRIHVSAVIH